MVSFSSWWWTPPGSAGCAFHDSRQRNVPETGVGAGVDEVGGGARGLRCPVVAAALGSGAAGVGVAPPAVRPPNHLAEKVAAAAPSPPAPASHSNRLRVT